MATQELLIVSEAARMLDLSVRRVQQLADEGKLPVIRTQTGVRLFKAADIRRELARRSKAKEAEEAES